MPLKNVSLRLAELVETMQDAENRRSLSEVVAAAIQSVLDFESNILRSIRDRTLTNHHVAVTTSRFHSSTADRQFSRIESTSGSSVSPLARTQHIFCAACVWLHAVRCGM